MLKTRKDFHHLTAQIDDPTPPEALPCTVHTLVRPLGRFPPGFEANVKSNAKGLISPMNNERMLLNSLLGLRCDAVSTYQSSHLYDIPSNVTQSRPRCDCRARLRWRFFRHSPPPDERSKSGPLVSHRTLPTYKVARNWSAGNKPSLHERPFSL